MSFQNLPGASNVLIFTVIVMSGNVKRICEMDLDLVSQCCLTKHVFRLSNQYLANVALKINVKVGGSNTVLMDASSRCIPLVSDRHTIIFGADVTHPRSGEDSSPSIAAVVASQDWPEVTKYAGLVCAQGHRQGLIQDLFREWQDPQHGTVTGGRIKELLISFEVRIIFYRDGACPSTEPNYQQPVTSVVVQKRHRTRLFANNHSDRCSVDRIGNILPGYKPTSTLPCTMGREQIHHWSASNFDKQLLFHAMRDVHTPYLLCHLHIMLSGCFPCPVLHGT